MLVYINNGILFMKPEFWTQSPNSWNSMCQILPLASICQIKRHAEGHRMEIYYKARDTPWEEEE
jgi:hypothetical protein